MMIEEITIQRFKALKDLTFPLSKLTLLSGLNGSGKSTLIQSLLLLRQSFLEKTLFSSGILLRGPLVNLGTGKDVFHQFSAEESIVFEINYGTGNPRWKLGASMDAYVLPIEAPQPSACDGSETYSKPPFSEHFWYIPADRIGPETSYPSGYESNNLWGPLGSRGEFTIDYLAKNANNPLKKPQLIHRSLSSDSSDLLSATRAWLTEISPGVSFTSERFPVLDQSIIRFDYSSRSESSFYHKLRPTNVGFGLTYVLPVITSLLAAEAGDLVIIENPESHLHPKGQMQIGILAAAAAAGGVQVIIETHSDHILNGVRLATKKKILEPADLSILYFKRNPLGPDHFATVTPIAIDNEGKLNEWPEGFFDQWEAALHELF